MPIVTKDGRKHMFTSSRGPQDGPSGVETRRGRPRDPRLGNALLAAAERQLRERGYRGMSLESVASDAGTTVPSLLRRFPNKTALAVAVVDSLRIDPLPEPLGGPRDYALAILTNLERNLRRDRSMQLLGTLLAEEERTPQLVGRFRTRLSRPRRDALRAALQAGIEAGSLSAGLDLEATVNLLIGSFYARYIADGAIPRGWAARVLAQVWP
jgi:AcrR family transcriptional regulator